MGNIETDTMAKFVIEDVVNRFGVPGIIHSDQGRQYESKVFSEMGQLLGIGKTRTTSYHPKSAGMVEQFSRTLLTMLSTYINEIGTRTFHMYVWPTVPQNTRQRAAHSICLCRVEEEIDLLESEVAHCDLSEGFGRQNRQRRAPAWQSDFILDWNNFKENDPCDCCCIVSFYLYCFGNHQ